MAGYPKQKKEPFRKAALPLLSFSLLVNLYVCQGTVIAAEQSAPRRLSCLEAEISGKSSSGSIENRIRKLELAVFGKSKSGALGPRIKSLEDFAGISESNELPPAAPDIKAAVSGKKPTSSASPGSDKDKLQAKSKAVKTEDLEKSLEAAVTLHRQGKVSEAEQSLQAILHDSPGNADAYFSLGAIAESRGDLQAALDFYTSAMQANPGDAEASKAVSEISRKITSAKVSAPFVNPLDYRMLASSPKVLQASAQDISIQGQAAGQGPFTAAIRSPAPPPTLGVSQAAPRRASASSTIARTLARAALSTALSGSGLHCPMCQLLRGF